jgi:hypothetical protein
MLTKTYQEGMGHLPTLTLYELKHEPGPGVEVFHNWRLTGRNGEPLANGTGEKHGAFKSARSAWTNAIRTAQAFDSKWFAFPAGQFKVPRVNADFVALNGDDRPFLRVRRIRLQ